MTIQPYQIFGFTPNWAEGISIKYAFNTAIVASERYKEQRKPLRSFPNTSLSCTFLNDVNGNKIGNYLQAALKSIVYVPIYSEPMRTTTTGTGNTTLAVGSILNFFNLKFLTRYVVLIDNAGISSPAVAELVSVGSTTIVIGANTWTFNSRTVIFPAMLAILDSVSKTIETQTLYGYSCTFTSYTDGSDPQLLAADEDELFECAPDWATRPELGVDFGRDVIIYDSAATRYRSLTDLLGWSVNLGYTNTSKNDEYNLLNFFCRHKGQLQRFWYSVPLQYFELAANINAGDKRFSISDPSFADIWQGYEHFFMRLKNGTTIVKKMASKINQMTFETISSFKDPVNVTNVKLFGRHILCRFAQDELELKYETPAISTCSVSLRELVHEYDDSRILS